MVTMTRMTADERRGQLLAIACEEFALRGLHGTSAETIARRADISQPYLFRLYGTKKGLFVAVVKDVYRRVVEALTQASEGLSGSESLCAMGATYAGLLKDRAVLLIMLHGFAACDDAAVRETVRHEFSTLWRTVARISGQPLEEVKRFLAMALLLNNAAAMDVENLDEPWASVLLTHPFPDRQFPVGCSASAD
jgi:AcrR family transcriptional regulator